MTNEEAPSSRSSSGAREPVLYHYTSYFGLDGIVSSKSIWCSQIQYLNDTTELKHGLEILSRTCSNYGGNYEFISEVPKRAASYRNVLVFVFSLSEVGDLLSQWRGYSGTSGVSIEFSYEKLKSQAHKARFALAKCVYCDQEKREISEDFVARLIKDFENGINHNVDQIVAQFLQIAARFKNKSFSEENEWRLISPIMSIFDGHVKVRATASGLIPYVIFDLKTGLKPLLSDLQPWRTNEDICVTSVIAGPNREQELQTAAIGYLFDTNDAYIKSCGRSNIPYRVF